MRRLRRSVVLCVACIVAGTNVAVALESATTTSATPVAATPKSGPLSKKPRITLPTGLPPHKLVKTDLIRGTGVAIVAGDTVTVNEVVERYSDGKVFQSTWPTRQPLTEGLATNQVIPGVIQGLVGMRVCGRRELIIPPKLTGADPTTLRLPAARITQLYVVDLLGVTSANGGPTHVCGPNSTLPHRKQR